jgi:hypothetical protein
VARLGLGSKILPRRATPQTVARPQVHLVNEKYLLFTFVSFVVNLQIDIFEIHNETRN